MMDRKKLEAMVQALRDTTQSASNAIASNVSGPIDLISAGLRGVGLPIPENAVGGSKWMADKGLTREVEMGAPRIIGETLGMAGPTMATAYAPQLAATLNKGAANLARPAALNPQAGAVYGGDIAEKLNAKYGDDVDAYLAEGKNLHLSKIVVPKEARNQGTGSRFMQDLADAADEQGKMITLTPASDFGGNKARLEEFYKRFGFVPNKGRNKDFAISEAMYRVPQQSVVDALRKKGK